MGKSREGASSLPSSNKSNIGKIGIDLEDSLELCTEIIANTRCAVEVLDDLLNYDKIESGGLALDHSFVSVEYLLEMVIKPFTGPARQKDITIITDTTDFLKHSVFRNEIHHGKFTSLRLIGDKVRLQQVVRNLISNALKFTPILGKINVKLEWIEKGLEEIPLSVEVANMLKVPNTLSSIRRAENSFTSMTLNSFGSFSKSNRIANSARLIKKESGEFDTLEVIDPTILADSVSGTPTTLGSHERKVIETRPNLDFSRQKVLKAAYDRAPKDVSTCQRYGSVRLSITDSGAGMTSAQLAKVCMEGIQFNANELQAGQGSGLGLFIAKGNL